MHKRKSGNLARFPCLGIVSSLVSYLPSANSNQWCKCLKEKWIARVGQKIILGVNRGRKGKVTAAIFIEIPSLFVGRMAKMVWDSFLSTVATHLRMPFLKLRGIPKRGGLLVSGKFFWKNPVWHMVCPEVALWFSTIVSSPSSSKSVLFLKQALGDDMFISLVFVHCTKNALVTWYCTWKDLRRGKCGEPTGDEEEIVSNLVKGWFGWP